MGVKVSFKFSIANLHSNEFAVAVQHFLRAVLACSPIFSTPGNNLVDIIRLVTRLFQQVRYSHDIAVLLQPCVVNLVTFLFIMTVSDLSEQPCSKSDNAI